MFRFGNQHPKDPLADPRSAERWLASFPANDALALHGEALAALAKLTDGDVRLTPARLEAVFRLDAGTADLRRSLTAQYVEHSSRSSKIENQLWSVLFDAAQAFLLAYQAFAKEITAQPRSGKWERLVPELIVRQVMALGLDAKTRLFRYEHWIPARWAELNDHFTLACSSQVERRPIVLGSDATTTTIEHAYLAVLMLQLMNTGNLTARQLEWVAQQLDEWCAPLKLTLEPSAACSFYVDLDGRDGLRRRTAGPLEGRVLFLDTRPLHGILVQNRVVLEERIRSQALAERNARQSEHADLLGKLASRVDPEFKPLARRGERSAMAGTVDAIVGFAKISSFMRAEDREPRPKSELGSSFGGTMELAVFGRVRNEQDRTAELARRRLSAYAAPGGPWEVRDASHTGFRLVAPMSVANTVTLGTLAAIRAAGEMPWLLGVVRRIRRLTSDRAEIGLQVIANAVTGVDVIEQRKSAEDDYSVNGVTTAANGRVFPGLFLALRMHDRGIQSLVVPAGEYRTGRRLRMQTAQGSFAIRFGRPLEHQPDWVWAAVEPLDPHAPPPAAAGEPSPATG